MNTFFIILCRVLLNAGSYNRAVGLRSHLNKHNTNEVITWIMPYLTIAKRQAPSYFYSDSSKQTQMSRHD